MLELLKADIKPRDIMTRAAFENAMVIVMALGGSTNAVLHLLAMARACGVALTLDDFQACSDRTPFIADLKPSGKYVMEDVHKVQLISLIWPHVLIWPQTVLEQRQHQQYIRQHLTSMQVNVVWHLLWRYGVMA